jgi:hypothetical protein
MNLTHAVAEYEPISFVYVVHVVFIRGLLFSAQQSVEFTVPANDLYPTGHALQEDAVETFENVSAAHSRHGPALAVGLNEPFGQDTHTELFMPFGAYPKLHVLHESASEL